MGLKLLQLASALEQTKVCSWERNSHSAPSAEVSGAYRPLPLYLLQLAKVLQPVSCIKIQMWKTLPVSSLNFFCCCSGDRGWVFFFFLPLQLPFYCGMYEMVKG